MAVVAFPHKRFKDDRAGEILSLTSEAKSILQTFLHEWWEGVAFYRGDQWTVWDQSTGRLRRRPVLPWRIRLTDNQTMPLILRQQAMLTEKQPSFSAMPRTEDDEDVLAAEAFEALLKYQWDRLDLTEKLADALLWALTTGNCFWRVDWDANAGKGVLVPVGRGSSVAGGDAAPEAGMMGDSAMDEFVPGMEEADMSMVMEGDIQIRVVSPFQIVMDPTAARLEDARWITQESFVHVSVLKDQFGSKAESLAADVSAEEFYNYEQSLRFDRGTSTYMSEDSRQQIRVFEYWERPTKEHSEGRVVTVAGGQVLDERDNPYGGRFPYVHFPAVKVPGRVWADGYVKHLRPLQSMHNRALSRFHEIMNLMGNPKWIADKHAGLKENSINDRPGEVIIKNPGSEVIAVPPPPPPTIHPQIMSLALNSMQTITGVNDPLVGQNPPNVRSASALFGLQEAAMRSFIPLALQTEGAIRNAGRLILNMVQRFYTEDRHFRIIGRTGRPKIYHLKHANVSHIEDVTVVHGSMTPASRSAQQDRTMQLLQVAPFLFTDEDGQIDRDSLMRLLDMPSVSGNVTLDDVDRSQAYQEHIDAQSNKPLSVQPWENDRLHMRLHAKRMQDRSWTEENPEAAKALAAHYGEHEIQVQQKQSGDMVSLQGGPQEPQDQTQGPQGPEGQGGGLPPGGPPPQGGGPPPAGQGNPGPMEGGDY